MRALRLLSLAAALSVLVFALNPAGAADDNEKKPGQRGQGKGQFQKGQFQGFGQRGLLSDEAVEKLKLTAEQKEKFTKIDDEFKDKQKANGEKAREAFQSKDREKIQEALQNMRTDGEKLRTE